MKNHGKGQTTEKTTIKVTMDTPKYQNHKQFGMKMQKINQTHIK